MDSSTADTVVVEVYVGDPKKSRLLQDFQPMTSKE